MPGIAGVCAMPTEQGSLAGPVISMLRRMQPGSQDLGRHITSSECAVLGGVGRDGQLASLNIATSSGSAIVFDGALYGNGERHGRVDAKDNAANSDARLMLDGYLQDGASYLAGLEGRFTAAVWDGKRRRCALITDKFGTKPLYFSRVGGRLAFASEIKALLALPWQSSELNHRGLVQFFAFGHLWNRDTYFASIECLDAATVAEFDVDASDVKFQRYWRPRITARRDAGESLLELDHCLKAAIDDRTRGAERLGVSLSGGLDARTLLGLMDCETAPATCVSLGMEGSLDQRSAQRLAELAHCEYHTLILGQGFLSDFEKHLQDMVDLTDGHYLSQCIVMPTLPLYAKLGVRTLLRGHAGELVHMHKAYNFSVDASVRGVRSQETLHSWLFPRLQSHLTDGVDELLLSGVTQQDFAAIAHDSLKTALQQTAHWEHPVDCISQLFLDQRIRRETAMSLVKFNSVVDLQLPYLDSRFVDAVFASHPDLRIGETIQTFMLQKRRPEFKKPVNSNTGAPVGAGAVRRNLCYLRMRVLAKLGVKGFQPYERLGLWLRRELRPVVEKVLLAPTCLDRGLLQPDAVRNVVQRHMNGEKNHTFLVMAMMILETALQRMVDNRPAGSVDMAKNGELRSPLRPARIARNGTPN
jgi:asparagine synthase (glutamine-hydrolysing)